MALDKEVILLDFWPSMFGMRVRIALAEKEVDYEYRDEDLTNKGDFLLKMNPVHKKIPVLIHKGRPICESHIILEYIDKVWSGKIALLPSDPLQRAHARFWVDFIDKKISGCVTKIAWTSKEDENESGKKELIEYLTLLEEELGDKPYFGGDTINLVDVALVPFYSWFYTFETIGNFKIEDSCPTLIAWAKRCLQRDSISKSLPDEKKIHEKVSEVRKLRGL